MQYPNSTSGPLLKQQQNNSWSVVAEIISRNFSHSITFWTWSLFMYDLVNDHAFGHLKNTGLPSYVDLPEADRF